MAGKASFSKETKEALPSGTGIILGSECLTFVLFMGRCISGSLDRHKDVSHVDGSYWLYFLDPGRRRWHYVVWWKRTLLVERQPGLGMLYTGIPWLRRFFHWLWGTFDKESLPPARADGQIELLDEFVPHDELYDDPNSTTTFPYLLENE